VERPFTIGILRDDESVVFEDRADRGRMPSAQPDPVDVPAAPSRVNYPPIPAAYLFHEFFSRTPAHQARNKERKRLYGMMNINMVAIPNSPENTCAVWHLPWPKESSTGSLLGNTGNRLSLGAGGMSYSLADALGYVRRYRDEENRSQYGIPNLRNSQETKIRGFLTPGEVGIPLAAYMDSVFQGSSNQDADYVRARNSLFGYISDCITTRSDVYACYVTIQIGPKASDGRRWSYAAVIDRSNVMTNADKAAVLMLTRLK